MVLFLAGSVNPNALEIAAGLALWATLLSWFSRPDPELDRSRAVRATVAASALVMSRALSPAFLVLIVGGSLLVLERGASRRVWRAARIAAGVVGAMTIAALAWTIGVGSLATSGVAYPEYQDAGRYLVTMLLSLNEFERQMIGVFGWLDTPADPHVYTCGSRYSASSSSPRSPSEGRAHRLLLLGLHRAIRRLPPRRRSIRRRLSSG